MFTRLIIQVTDTAFPKMFEVPIKKRIVIGRSDVDDPFNRPDVDLIAFNAIRNGISRAHAAIERQPSGELHLIDLNSRNGTQVNGDALTPQQPHVLQDGDKIDLGQLRMTIYLE